MRTTPSIPTPPDPAYFDYKSAATAAGISRVELASLVEIFEADYPDDLMMRELHVLRACNAISRGVVTVSDFLSGQQAA